MSENGFASLVNYVVKQMRLWEGLQPNLVMAGAALLKMMDARAHVVDVLVIPWEEGYYRLVVVVRKSPP
jgi:hypothetical protein